MEHTQILIFNTIEKWAKTCITREQYTNVLRFYKTKIDKLNNGETTRHSLKVAHAIGRVVVTLENKSEELKWQLN